jgi:hypothetical protein
MRKKQLNLKGLNSIESEKGANLNQLVLYDYFDPRLWQSL